MTKAIHKSLSEDLMPDNGSSAAIYVMTAEQKKWIFAMVDCNQSALSKLINNNPELINWKSFIDGTAVHHAAKCGDVGLIRFLAGVHQANVNAQNYGLTPLHYAAASANQETILLLTSNYQADISIRDYFGKFPCDYLPRNPDGDALRKYLPCPVETLLKNRKNLLYLLAKPSAPTISFTGSETATSSKYENEESGSISPQHLRHHRSSLHADNENGLLRNVKHISPSRLLPFSLDLNTDKSKKSKIQLKTKSNTLPRPQSAHETVTPEIALENLASNKNIHEHIKLTQELKVPLFNPLCPTSRTDNTTVNASRLAPVRATIRQSQARRDVMKQHQSVSMDALKEADDE